MSHVLPEKGMWQVTDRDAARRHCAGAVPFDLIKLDLRGREAGGARGTVRARNLETRLGRIRVTGPDRFAAIYDIRGHRGVLEGTLRPDGSLRLDLSGTVAGSFVARAAEPASAEAGVALRAFAGAVGALCRSAGMERAAA